MRAKENCADQNALRRKPFDSIARIFAHLLTSFALCANIFGRLFIAVVNFVKKSNILPTNLYILNHLMHEKYSNQSSSQTGSEFVFYNQDLRDGVFNSNVSSSNELRYHFPKLFRHRGLFFFCH